MYLHKLNNNLKDSLLYNHQLLLCRNAYWLKKIMYNAQKYEK